MFRSETQSVDILIVGAGPVGLFLANECARRGVTFRIIETNSGQSQHSKALAIFPRTLEIFDMAGLAHRFLEVANRVKSVAVMSGDRSLARIQFEPDNTPYSFVAMVPQNITEKLLVEALKEKGASIEYRTRFVSLEQEADSVLATIERDGHSTTLRASFVVGCDGAHSAVRNAIGIELVGGDYDSPLMLADIEATGDLPGDELQLCSSARGPVAIFPISKSRRRVVAIIEAVEGEAPTLEYTQRLLAERAPSGLRAHALHWSSYFLIHRRHAPRLRTGRVFLAGDAAHIHSPFGGQGMNTGLHDIWNLAWKLEFGVRGQATEKLLDSYAEERIPVIQDVIQTTDRLTQVLGAPSTLAQFLRDSLIPAVSHFSVFRHAMVERLSGLGISYEGSSIVRGNGRRAFYEWMRNGQVPRIQFTLLVPDEALPRLDSAVRCLPDVLQASIVVRASSPNLQLIRPDGYLAFCSENTSYDDAANTIQSIFTEMIKGDSSFSHMGAECA